jgi:hypothetical protein
MRPDEMSLEEQLIASTAVANFRRQKTEDRRQEKTTMEKLSFETNVPQTVALKYANGKRVESRYNDYEVYYSLADGRALYAPPALAERIAALEPAPGEEFSICKREMREGNKRRIDWQVLPVAAKHEARKPASPTPAPAPANEPRNGSSTCISPQSTAAMPAQATMTQMMGGALIASIDALLAARDYAAQKGLALTWNEEDVRATAASIFIQYFREAENRSRQQYFANRDQAAQARVNGGAAWQQ